MTTKTVAILGGGPAGLAAAEVLGATGRFAVTVHEAMPTIGRKFLLAGKSGLNITHSEDFSAFAGRFGAASGFLRPALDAFGPHAVRAWAQALGSETFVGTSGRVFPVVMKASPLLRAWRARLEASGVTILTRHRFTGFRDHQAIVETPAGLIHVRADAFLLAFGGASWPRLGSDAAWVHAIARHGVGVVPFRPANCGFERRWSDGFRDRFAGEPVKSVSATSDAGEIQGEFVITRHGVEGSLVYAHAASLRDRIDAAQEAVLTLDLLPNRAAGRIARDMARQDRKASFSNRLRKGTGLQGVKAALVRECVPDAATLPPDTLAALLKALPLSLERPRPIAEAISSAGGITLDSIDERYMLKALPGTFAAGEMLDWEAPTGGYLLTACLATGRAAARGIEAWLGR
ncbi:TIGR03862 family flavoprotein [Rhizobiaceae bacterium BDR2-2]|uniref:TIGR03862 family flavoprotein n=1 Tax=Ectorhizobium quercum TaxID=2965071 RepID=A0AAE3SUV7_9HYPH|nr:TIGR03862 family flavoprotein [Ectorhizobium quercum]MCX8997655.1 TIGR03862 family flavoprotein [Ectorhizobium quercum]